jgi:hypothetical protein
MKKYLSLIVLLLTTAFADVRGSISESLSATGASTRVINVLNAASDAFVLIYTTTGGPATLNIRIEGSNNGVFTTCGTAATNTTSGKVVCTGNYETLRVNLVTLTGGTAPTVRYSLSAGNASLSALSLPISNSAPATALVASTIGVTETYFDVNIPLPANYLRAGKVYKLTGSWKILSSGGPTIVHRNKMCTVSGCASGSVVNFASGAAAIPTTGTRVNGMEFYIRCLTVGGSGTIAVSPISPYFFQPASTNVLNLDSSAIVIDTTVAQFVSTSVQYGAGTAGNSAQLIDWIWQEVN